MPQPNFLAIIIASFIPMIVGFIYYHKSVFGKAWMSTIGVTEENLKKGNMVVIFGVSLLMSFLLSWFLLYNVDGPGQEGPYDSFRHGLFHGLELGILVAMPIMVTNALFERKNFKYIAINVGYWLITLMLMGGVIDAINHWPSEWPVTQ